MIEGVKTRKLKAIPDERGYLMEMLRSDWEEFEKFGQVYVAAAYPGAVKAWHYHRLQTDHLICLQGMAKVALYDGREDSPTYRQVEEFFIGHLNPLLIKIPPLVMHGFKGLGPGMTLMVNVPTELYNYQEPDEYRLPPDTDQIPYDWARKDR